MRETRVKSLGWEDPLEKKMATHSSTLAWKIPWMEKPGRLQSVGSQRVGHDWVTSLSLIPIRVVTNAKECSNYHTIALISHASKVTLKILQARPQEYVNRELPDVQAGFRKGRGTRDQIANICWIIKKTEFQKNIYFCFIDYAKAFDCVVHNKLWKILKEMGIPDHPTCLCIQVQKQRLELDMDNRLVPNRKRSTSRLYIVTLLI